MLSKTFLFYIVELFPYGAEFGDINLSLSDDSSERIYFPITFAGTYFSNVYVSSNGLLSLDTSFTEYSPRVFPFQSPPIIAPFWLDLNPLEGGQISYRYLSNFTAIDEVINNYNIYNDCNNTYDSASALLVTWEEVRLIGSTNFTETFQVVLTSDGMQSYALFLYSNEMFPARAAVGINVGDGINFISEASPLYQDSSTIGYGSNIERRGLYLYRLDDLPGKSLVKFVPFDCQC